METKQNLDDKMKTKEDLFKLILEDKENKINEISFTLEFLKTKIRNLEDDNYNYEEMINRYKKKLGSCGEYFTSEDGSELFTNSFNVIKKN